MATHKVNTSQIDVQQTYEIERCVDLHGRKTLRSGAFDRPSRRQWRSTQQAPASPVSRGVFRLSFRRPGLSRTAVRHLPGEPRRPPEPEGAIEHHTGSTKIMPA